MFARVAISKVVGKGGSIKLVSANILSARNEKSCDFLWYEETRFADWEIKGLHRDAWRVLLRFNAGNDTPRREKNESQVFCRDVRFTWRHFGFASATRRTERHSSALDGEERFK